MSITQLYSEGHAIILITAKIKLSSQIAVDRLIMMVISLILLNHINGKRFIGLESKATFVLCTGSIFCNLTELELPVCS